MFSKVLYIYGFEGLIPPVSLRSSAPRDNRDVTQQVPIEWGKYLPYRNTVLYTLTRRQRNFNVFSQMYPVHQKWMKNHSRAECCTCMVQYNAMASAD